MMNKIPFVDLHTEYLNNKTELDQAIAEVISECAFIGTASNRFVKQFEQDFADYIGIQHCIGCGNGTDALEITLKALGIGAGDEVIVPALSWIATSESVSSVGATPVFADIEPNFYTINSELIEEKITSNTRAIIPVHLYGHPADMHQIISIARKYNLKVIEDCAQAHGAEINGKKTGTFGDLATFSFFPGKNLGAYGDAGGIVTNHKELAETCRMISQHGQLLKKHIHFIEGRNSRLDGIQAAILSVKLKYLEEWTAQRISLANLYNEKLNVKVKTPKTQTNYKHVFHLYVIESDKRDEIAHKLKTNQVSWAIQYPTPLPFLDAYKERGYTRAEFPVATKASSNILSLPIYPELTKQQIELICNLID